MKNKLIIALTTIILIAFLVVLWFFSPDTVKNGKLNVYVFYAGGCPYCEKQIEYLKSLESYGKKFDIIKLFFFYNFYPMHVFFVIKKIMQKQHQQEP